MNKGVSSVKADRKRCSKPCWYIMIYTIHKDIWFAKIKTEVNNDVMLNWSHKNPKSKSPWDLFKAMFWQ